MFYQHHSHTRYQNKKWKCIDLVCICQIVSYRFYCMCKFCPLFSRSNIFPIFISFSNWLQNIDVDTHPTHPPTPQPPTHPVFQRPPFCIVCDVSDSDTETWTNYQFRTDVGIKVRYAFKITTAIKFWGKSTSAVSTFSPIVSPSSNGLRVCACGWNELKVCSTLAYPHISSFCTMLVHVSSNQLRTANQWR